MGDLRQRMNPGICAPGSGDVMGAWFQFAKRSFDRTLHRWQSGLTLPADKGRAVVFNFQGKAGHGLHLSWGSLSGNP